MTVDHIGKHSIPGNLCLPLLEKLGKSREFHVVWKVVSLDNSNHMIVPFSMYLLITSSQITSQFTNCYRSWHSS